MEQASEFLFLLKQSFDEIVVRMLSWVFDPTLAQAIGAIVSVNMLSGFVLALYAVLIAEGIRTLERRSCSVVDLEVKRCRSPMRIPP